MINAVSTHNLAAQLRQIAATLKSEERGQNMVEMAVVLVMLLGLTFGMIDFSRALYTASVVRAAAQEGARAGIIDRSEIMDAVQSKMVGLDMASADVNIDTTQANIVAVSIAYEFNFVSPMIDGLVESIELTGNASMVTQ